MWAFQGGEFERNKRGEAFPGAGTAGQRLRRSTSRIL